MKLGRTLVSTLACALAFAAADTPADIAPQVPSAPSRWRPTAAVSSSASTARGRSWLYASDDGGGTWRRRAASRDRSGDCLAFAPSDGSIAYAGVIRALRAARQRLLRLDRRRFDLAREAWKSTVESSAGNPGRDRRDRRRSAPAAHRVRRHTRGPAQEPERRRLVGGREGGASADPRHPIVTQPATRGGTRRALYYATGRRSGPGQVYRSVDRGARWRPAGQGSRRRSGLVAAGAGRRRHPRGDDLRSNGARPLRDHEQRAALATSAERSVDRCRDCAERASAGRRDRLATARPRPPGRRRWCVEAAARAARRPLDVHARSCERGQDLRRGIHAERCDLERVRNALGIRERRCDMAVGWALAAAGAEELSLSASREGDSRRRHDERGRHEHHGRTNGMSVFSLGVAFPARARRGEVVTDAIWQEMPDFSGYLRHVLIEDLDDPGTSSWSASGEPRGCRHGAGRVREQPERAPGERARRRAAAPHARPSPRTGEMTRLESGGVSRPAPAHSMQAASARADDVHALRQSRCRCAIAASVSRAGSRFDAVALFLLAVLFFRELPFEAPACPRRPRSRYPDSRSRCWPRVDCRASRIDLR